MRHSIATVSLSGSLTDRLEAAAAAGFDGVEIFEPDLTASPLSPAEVRRRCADLGLTIELFQPFRDGAGVPAEQFAATRRRFEHKLGLMAELGTDQVLVCSPVTPDASDDLDLAAEQLAELGALAGEHGVRVNYEALAWGTHVNRLAHAWEVVRRCGHPSVKVVVDTFHLISRGDGAEAVRAVDPGMVGFLQIADAPLRRENVLSWSRHHRNFPGQGDFDIAEVVAATLHNGYRGPLSLEVFSDVIREADPHQTALDARRSLILLEDALAARPDNRDGVGSGSGSTQEPAAPRESLELATVPPQAGQPAHTFVALRAPRPAALQVMLAGLGFQRCGDPTGLPAELWRSGSAHLLLVTDDGLLADPTPEHRPTIAAVGLAVPEPDALDARAQALLWPRVTVPGAAAERRPVITRSPAGVRVVAVGEDWTSVFGPLPATTDQTCIDHIGYPVDFAASDAELSYWHSLFGLPAGDISEVNHLRGWMRSRVVGVGTGAQVVLNVVEGGGPASQGQVDQVALGVSDVISRVAAAREQGVDFLPIPANYYRDLASRFDLDPRLLERLQAHDVMYDRDDHGELLHAYTRQVPMTATTSFYVELVERRGGHRGFGAANTPVRLVAQSR